MGSLKSKKDENCIIIEDKKGVISKLLDAEFYSGIFLERQKLIDEFLDDLDILPKSNFKDVAHDATRAAVDVYWIFKLKGKWEKRREKE